MEWRDIAPVTLTIGFLILWFFVPPRLDVRTT